MEKFVCVNGSDHLQIPNHLLEELSVVHPQDIHMNAGTRDGAKWVDQTAVLQYPFGRSVRGNPYFVGIGSQNQRTCFCKAGGTDDNSGAGNSKTVCNV